MKQLSKKIMVSFINEMSIRIKDAELPKEVLNKLPEEVLKQTIFSLEEVKIAFEVFCCETENERKMYYHHYGPELERMVEQLVAEPFLNHVHLLSFEAHLRCIPYGIIPDKQLFHYYNNFLKLEPNGNKFASIIDTYIQKQQAFFEKYK